VRFKPSDDLISAWRNAQIICTWTRVPATYPALGHLRFTTDRLVQDEAVQGGEDGRPGIPSVPTGRIFNSSPPAAAEYSSHRSRSGIPLIYKSLSGTAATLEKWLASVA
jgi:hypothetical protein